MAPTPPRILKVVERQRLSTNMLRIRFTGDSLADFPTDHNGAHIKLLFPLPGQDEPQLPVFTPSGIQWPSMDLKPIARTYSVRQFDAERQLLDVDFVDHGDTGPASSWARACKPGDRIGLAGPGGRWPMLSDTEHAILVADLSALPALYGILEAKPERPHAKVFVALESEEDRLTPPTSANIEWHWFVGPYPGAFRQLQSELEGHLRPSGSVCGWVAGERDLVLAARDFLTQQWQLSKANLYAVPYWRLAETEEDFHQARHDIMDAEY
ncbi:hypothetical protein BGP77_02600 [Saccharospirillum sp. MSK14-1]|uniref:siderophore-interacting protein n=1 Tax=Saccharospirillum sp. MSK14-1 TaxID=1897632 RepID=UPI000D37BD9F|nr:siderophore-interacting protein [Saccharospirillum sp. MSK14-1]PTY36219.1 hypothetical protein BGP77_02600 [Saccharospirillum sp. MSK14-1]